MAHARAEVRGPVAPLTNDPEADPSTLLGVPVALATLRSTDVRPDVLATGFAGPCWLSLIPSHRGCG